MSESSDAKIRILVALLEAREWGYEVNGDEYSYCQTCGANNRGPGEGLEHKPGCKLAEALTFDDDVPEGSDLRERLAAYAHDAAWSRWMRHLFLVSKPNPDGSVTIPADKVERWKRQMETAYADLPEQDRESDLQQADRILALMEPKGGS
jgi:hypothetical protein